MEREGVDYIMGVGVATPTEPNGRRARKRKFPFGFGKEPSVDSNRPAVTGRDTPPTQGGTPLARTARA